MEDLRSMDGRLALGTARRGDCWLNKLYAFNTVKTHLRHMFWRDPPGQAPHGRL